MDDAGNEYIATFADDDHRALMSFVGQALAHYCRTGTMLESGSVPN